MVRGTLEVLLVEAKGLQNTDLLKNMDPYAIIVCRTQEQRSSVASGKGSNPEWNESFVFSVSDSVRELKIKLMDSDNGTADDFVGEATIPLEAAFLEGNVPPTVYNVVKTQEYYGEIKIGLTFTPEFEESFIHLFEHARQEFLASSSPSGVEDFEISDSEEDIDNINDESEQYIETNHAQESLEFFLVEEEGRVENMECAICIEKMEYREQEAWERGFTYESYGGWNGAK